MAARGDAYKALSEQKFATADGLFTAEITNAVNNLVDLLTGRARSRFGAMDYHGAIEDCNTALQFNNFNLTGLYYLGFSYLRLKRYNEARASLARCPKVEGLFNVNPLLEELEAAAAAAEEEASAAAAAAEEEASAAAAAVAAALIKLSEPDPEPEPEPEPESEPEPENLWTEHYTKSLSVTDVTSKLSLKRTLGEAVITEAMTKVAGVQATSKRLDMMIQMRDNDQDRRKVVLHMQDRKDSFILWKKELNLMKEYNVAVGTQVTFYHCWVTQDEDGIQIPLLKLEYNI